MNVDFLDFRDWLRLEPHTKKNEDFEEFWKTFFAKPNLKEQLDRFRYVDIILRDGPITSWFKWLKNSLLIYTFIKQNPTILELAVESNVPLNRLAMTLRNFFVWKFPYKREYFSKFFNLSNLADSSAYLTFKEMSSSIELKNDFNGVCEDDLMQSLDLSAYDYWPNLTKKINKNFNLKEFSFKKLMLATHSRKFLIFIRDVLILVAIAITLIYSVRRFNSFYENYLVGKIRLYEPTVLENEATQNTLEQVILPVAEVPTIESIEEQERMTRMEAEIERDPISSVEFGTESELTITSWDALPKDFDTVKLETSVYEDISKGEYRYSSYGTKTNYRVVINSIDPEATHKKLEDVLDKYKVTQADNVKPGTEIPGGFYYNLFVPREHIKEFLAQIVISDSNRGVIYLNRTRRDNPPGLTKVFIWLKRY